MDAKPVMGRPSLYRDEYCQTAIEFLSEGYSILALAAHIGVDKKTIFNWRDAYPEFDAAVRRGIAGAVLWWETRAHELVQGTTTGNAAVCIFGLKNRAADEWREQQHIDHQGGINVLRVMRGEKKPDGTDGPA